MKTLKILLALIILSFTISCEPEPGPIPEPTYGNITFWQSGTPPYTTITVTIYNYNTELSCQITKDYPDGISGCNITGCANFSLPTGEYRFYAATYIHIWSGTVAIVANKCLKFQLEEEI